MAFVTIEGTMKKQRQNQCIKLMNYKKAKSHPENCCNLYQMGENFMSMIAMLFWWWSLTEQKAHKWGFCIILDVAALEESKVQKQQRLKKFLRNGSASPSEENFTFTFYWLHDGRSSWTGKRRPDWSSSQEMLHIKVNDGRWLFGEIIFDWFISSIWNG